MACIQEAFVPIMYIHMYTIDDTMLDIGAKDTFCYSPILIILLKATP